MKEFTEKAQASFLTVARKWLCYFSYSLQFSSSQVRSILTEFGGPDRVKYPVGNWLHLRNHVRYLIHHFHGKKKLMSPFRFVHIHTAYRIWYGFHLNSCLKCKFNKKKSLTLYKLIFKERKYIKMSKLMFVFTESYTQSHYVKNATGLSFQCNVWYSFLLKCSK